MKKWCYLFLLLSFCASAQTDSIKKKIIGIQLSFPFEVGLSYFTPDKANHPLANEHLLNSAKAFGTRGQILSTQLHFYDRVFVEYAYNLDNQPYDKNEGINKLRERNPDYFIQEEGKYNQETEVFYGSYSLNYSRVGIGCSIYLPKYLYLRPYVCYAFGTATLPTGRYGFKEYTTNRYFTENFSNEKLKTSGFHAGVSLCNFWNSDDPSKTLTALAAIKLEFSEMTVKGMGSIRREENFQSDVVTWIPINKKFRYITIGIFLGLTGSKDKRHIKTSH